MKITKELEERITSSISEKNKAEVEGLKIQQEKIIDALTEQYVKWYDTEVKTKPEIDLLFLSLCKGVVYRGYGDSNVAADIKFIVGKYVVVENKEWKAIRDRLNEIRQEEKKLVSDIRIAVSYGKTFEDIKTVFSNNGLEF